MCYVLMAFNWFLHPILQVHLKLIGDLLYRYLCLSLVNGIFIFCLEKYIRIVKNGMSRNIQLRSRRETSPDKCITVLETMILVLLIRMLWPLISNVHYCLSAVYPDNVSTFTR